MLSLDTETTGVDLRHGAQPYFVTMCDLRGTLTYYRWDVDPMTRRVMVDQSDVAEIRARLATYASWQKFDGETADRHVLVLQNSQFDAAALSVVGIGDFPWPAVRDTLLAAHLLGSNQRKDLTSLAIQYLGKNIEPQEEALKRACNEARRLCRSKFPEWRIAKKGLPEMPSSGESVWMADTWLPYALARELGEPDDHPWYRVAAEYANLDSAVTCALWPAMEREISRRGLEAHYRERLKLLPIVVDMESGGVTLSRSRLLKLKAEFGEEAERSGRVCRNLACSLGYDLDLPSGSRNNSLMSFMFREVAEAEAAKRAERESARPRRAPAGARSRLETVAREVPDPSSVAEPIVTLDLPVFERTETGMPAMTSLVLDRYVAELPPRSRQSAFVRALRDRSKRNTAVSYLEGYERFWRPVADGSDYYVLWPRLNPTGTQTLRWSSSNPNEQNIARQEGFNLREAFGPVPGREWWSLDYQNLELRIPAYKAGETDAIRVFERPDEGPYYGSYHLLVADALHPERFARYGKAFKDVFESTWYRWVKIGSFAMVYGGQEETVDRAYRVEGAYKKVQNRFPRIAELAERQRRIADKLGYVETIPDRDVCPERGYPLLCKRTAFGKVLPTVPFNYFIQGTATWIIGTAMIQVHAFLGGLSRGSEFAGRVWPGTFRMALQVHDELVLDLPAGDGERPQETNLPVVREVARLMESCGDRVGVPTPVSATYHASNWGGGCKVDVR